MPRLIIQPTATAQWHSLVSDAQTSSRVTLGEELESYLVFLLMRFVRRPEVADRVMAVEYLEGISSTGTLRHDRMRDVGDLCLLFCGLFPRRAERRRVRISYFVELGRGAFGTLADAPTAGACLYSRLRAGFVSMMDVMHAMRGDDKSATLDLLSAAELWADTNSGSAQRVLQQVTNGQVIVGASGKTTDIRH